MGYLADIYVIKKSRSRKIGIDFLNTFLPNRQESADEYFIPQYSENPIHKFDNVGKLMIFLESNREYAQNIYWESTVDENLNKHAMIFYTKDGCMIFGISQNAETNGEFNTKTIDTCLLKMKEFLKTNIGYIDYENPPANTYKKFVELVEDLK